MSESQGCLQLRDHFAELTDPRRGKVTHPLLNIITIAVCAVICGADDFVAIAEFGRLKREWLAKFLDLTNGIPSHDRASSLSSSGRPVSSGLFGPSGFVVGLRWYW
ncbi:MAG: transposase family protein [Planctomycetales bacterium]